MNTMNTMMDAFHFDIVSESPQSTRKRKYHDCVTLASASTSSPDSNYSSSPHNKTTTRSVRRSSQQSPPPLRRMTDEDRMNKFAESMDEEAFSFLSFPSLPSSSPSTSGGVPRTPTQQENHDQDSTSLLLPAPRMRLAPRPQCFALPSELELRKARSLLDDDEYDDEDSESDDDDIDFEALYQQAELEADIDVETLYQQAELEADSILNTYYDDDDNKNDDLTSLPLLQTCLSFDSDNDDAQDDVDFARQRSNRGAAQNPLKALQLLDSGPYSSGPLLPMRNTTPSNQLLQEYQKQLKNELSISLPKGLMKLQHETPPLNEPEQHLRITYPAHAA